MGRNTQITIVDENDRQMALYKVPYGAKLFCDNNERAISEGIRRRAEKGGDMSVLSVLPWLKDEKRAVTCCGCGCESTITMGEALEWDDIDRWHCWECE